MVPVIGEKQLHGLLKIGPMWWRSLCKIWECGNWSSGGSASGGAEGLLPGENSRRIKAGKKQDRGRIEAE